MNEPIIYSFKRCPYAMRARMAIKLANIKCEIREVRLNNKPKQMLDISPKGTVPILILDNRVIEESNDIIEWVIEQNNIFKGNLNDNQINITNNLIEVFDNKFKYHLDRYKYSTRYIDHNRDLHREECLKILVDLEKRISNKQWIFGSEINKLDISILPFIRQFKIADPKWFDEQNKIIKIKQLLNTFLSSSLFKDIMYDYEVWKEGSKKSFFPNSLNKI